MCKAKSIVVRELCDHEFCDTIIPRHIRGGVVDFIKWDSGETLGASPTVLPSDACRVERRNPAVAYARFRTQTYASRARVHTLAQLAAATS